MDALIRKLSGQTDGSSNAEVMLEAKAQLLKMQETIVHLNRTMEDVLIKQSPEKIKEEVAENKSKLFFDEVLNQYESLSGVESTLGYETIIDMWYLSNALMQGNSIDVHDKDAGILVVIDQLPSKHIFMQHVNNLYNEKSVKPK